MTILEQREAYAALEPYWSGSIEAHGEVPGLSSYIGRSSLYHSASWERMDMLEHGMVKGNGRKVRGDDRKPRTPKGSKDAEVFAMLKKGCSYGAIMRALDVSMSVARRVGKLNGIDRSYLQGTNRRRDRVAAGR